MGMKTRGSVRCFWVLNRPEMHKRKQLASLLSSGWMNVDEEGGGFCSLLSRGQQTTKRIKHPKLCLLACLFLFIEPWMTCLCW